MVHLYIFLYKHIATGGGSRGHRKEAKGIPFSWVYTTDLHSNTVRFCLAKLLVSLENDTDIYSLLGVCYLIPSSERQYMPTHLHKQSSSQPPQSEQTLVSPHRVTRASRGQGFSDWETDLVAMCARQFRPFEAEERNRCASSTFDLTAYSVLVLKEEVAIVPL